MSCSRLRTIYLPDSLAEIGDSAFGACLILTSVKYAGSADDFAKIDIELGNTHMTGASIAYGARP
jgi:hypothetical protein